MWKNIRVGIAVSTATSLLIAATAYGWQVAKSDPPWLSLNTAQTLFLRIAVRTTIRDYCEAERNHNVMAAQAASDDLQDYELQFAALTGHATPIRPCP